MLKFKGASGFVSRPLVELRSRRHGFTGSSLQSTLSDSAQTSLTLPSNVHNWLDVELPEGRCVGVSIKDILESSSDAITAENVVNPNHWVHSVYHPDEIAYGMTLKPKVSSSFWMGRLAIRTALGFPKYPILKDSYGRPDLLSGVCGSISHKKDCGIALVSNVSNKSLVGIGVDLEMTARPGKPSIAKRVLTENERKSLGHIPGLTTDEEILLRFRYVVDRIIKAFLFFSLSEFHHPRFVTCSLKEAIYKAAHPLLCQYVGFKEAEVVPHADGTATCDWFLESDADKRIGNLTAHWRILEDDGFFLTSASVYSKDADTKLCGL